jgi:branched-subunit amino acid transport protein
MNAWVVVAAVGAGSYLFRISMLVLAARVGLPPVIERAARHAVPVSFAALAASAVTGQVTAAGTPAAAIAPVAAVAVAVAAVRRTGSPPAALAAGLPTLWVLSALLPA